MLYINATSLYGRWRYKCCQVTIGSIFLIILGCIDVQAQKRLTRAQFTEEQRRFFDSSEVQGSRARTFTDKALRIGDTVPDIFLNKVFNHPGGEARLSDFKGKHIILDFWARYCGTCIGAFPKMETLQKLYEDRVKILAVCTYNTWEALNMHEPGFPQASTSAGIRNTTLPLVFNSQDMVDFFPHQGEPYLVWIDSSRVVRAMIDSWDVNESMMDTLLAGHYNAYPLAVSFRRVSEGKLFSFYDHAYPLLKEGNGRNIDKVVYLKRSKEFPSAYVLLAKLGSNVGGITRRIVKDSISGEILGERRFCMSLIRLFRSAYPYSIDPQLVVVESNCPEKFYSPLNEAVSKWQNEHTYSYEVFAPSEKERRLLLQEALKQYFPDIMVKVERRKIKCLVLLRSSKDDKLRSRNENRPMDFDASPSLFSFTNAPFGKFLSTLQFFNLFIHSYKAIPIFDQTGYSLDKPIDIELRNLKDLHGLNRQLDRYGLSFAEVYRDEMVFVLKEQISK